MINHAKRCRAQQRCQIGFIEKTRFSFLQWGGFYHHFIAQMFVLSEYLFLLFTHF